MVALPMPPGSTDQESHVAADGSELYSGIAKMAIYSVLCYIHSEL